MTIETIEFAITILVFLGSLITVWINLNKKVEKVDTEVKNLIDYKNESATLVRSRFSKIEESIDRKVETMEKHFDAKFAEMRSEREALAAALEKQNEKLWAKLDAIETKIDAKFETLNKIRIEHEQQMACRYKER